MVTRLLPLMDIAKLVDTYAKGAEHLKKLTERQATLKSMLTKAIDEAGEVDDKGHRWLAAGEYMLQRQKRQGKPFLDPERAEDWAKALDIWLEVSVVKEELDLDKLAGWVYEHRTLETLVPGVGVVKVQEAYEELFVTPDPTFAFMPPVKAAQYEY